ncbi:hypothetical protein CTheo_8435 [Ceratobasidium theobromae]|uniref:Transmembrane protein n=1 Tax=Ceratobasidium theobromae TaxID=1582974 RepID=A0A5N5Q8N9_9AGAM|nr:hypothetical protein CTheo_8435 [Ceratobasidium theobromae]
MSRIRLYPVSPGEVVVVTLAAIIIGANFCSVSLDIPHWNDLVLLWHSALVGILSLLCIVPVSIVVLRFADILVATSLIFVWSVVVGTIIRVRNMIDAHRGYCVLFLAFAFGPGPSPQGFGWAAIVPVVVFSCRLALAALSLPVVMFRLALFYLVLTGWVGWSLIESGAAHCQHNVIFAIILHLTTWAIWTQWNIHQVKYRLERLWHVDYHIAQLCLVKYLLKRVNSGAPVLETIREQMPLEVVVIVVPKPQVSEFRASKERVEGFGALLRRMMGGCLVDAHLWTKYQYSLVQEKKLAGERRARSEARTMETESSNLVTGKSDRSCALKSSKAVLSCNKVTSSGLEAISISGAPKNAIAARDASIRSTSEVPTRTSTPKVSRSRRTRFISSSAVIGDRPTTKVRVIESTSNQEGSTGYRVGALTAVNSDLQLSQGLGNSNMVKTWVSEQATSISKDQQILTELETPADLVGAPLLGAPCVTWFTASKTFDHAVSTPVADLDPFVPAFCMDHELADLDAVWADLCIIPASETPHWQPLDEDVFESFKHDHVRISISSDSSPRRRDQSESIMESSPAPTETLEDLDWLSAISMATPVPIPPAQPLSTESAHDDIKDAEMCDSGTSGTLDVTMSLPDLVDIEMFPLAPACLPLARLPSLVDVQMTLSVVEQLEMRENKSTDVERRVSRKARIIYADGVWEEYMDGFRLQAAATKLSQLDVPPVPKLWSNQSSSAEKHNMSSLDSSDQLDGSAGEVKEELVAVVELHKRLRRGRRRRNLVCKPEKVAQKM